MSTVEEQARWVAERFVAGDANAIYQRIASNSEFKKNIPSAEAMKAFFATFQGMLGEFKGFTKIKHDRMGKMDMLSVGMQYQAGEWDLLVMFDVNLAIIAVYPRPKVIVHHPPPYAKPTGFVERTVQSGAPGWPLPSMFASPKKRPKKLKAGMPAVVFVHGSGPNDKDETIGGNRPFLDLAYGLACNDVASLRYEKRTKQHQDKLGEIAATITVREETIEDAVAGVQLVRKQEGVDPKRVYICGHSLGAQLAPFIAEEADAAGLILLAAPARPFEDILLEQMRYLASLPGDAAELTAKQIPVIEAQVAKLKSATKGKAPAPSELPLGLPLPYWQSLAEYEPLAKAAALRRPMLILQGERDYQITMDDFRLWEKALSGRSDVTFKSYPGLNHAFGKGTGPSTPQEYMQPANVDPGVVKDISAWIAAH